MENKERRTMMLKDAKKIIETKIETIETKIETVETFFDQMGTVAIKMKHFQKSF